MEGDHRALQTSFDWVLVLSAGGRVANLGEGFRVFSCMLPGRTIKHIDGSGHGGWEQVVSKHKRPIWIELVRRPRAP